MGQIERLIEAVTNLLETASLIKTSGSGGSQRETLVSGTKQAASQVCRFCRIQCAAANTEVVRVRIGTTCGATDGVELPSNPVLTPYSIDNLNLLYFFSADDDAIVDIEYFD